MKRTLLFLAVTLLCITESYSQATFNTGALEVGVSQYGRFRLSTTDGTLHLQRASILVGTSSTEVFDYTNDANELDPTVLVTSPTLSDFEIYGSVDNSYSSLPPNVVVKYNAYGWTSGSYTVVKFNVTNNESSAITASIGLDIIPEINETYGFDTVTYNSGAGVIRFHRGAVENMGMKLLSASFSSLYSFEWFTDYSIDSNYWNWMNFGSLQPVYISPTADGPVTITSQAPVVIAPGESFNVYYAMALGADEQTMLSNISEAELKYQSVIASVSNLVPPAAEFSLGQNYPNPFKNSTSIRYTLPGDGFVSLKIYNVIGNEVATLVSSNQTRGSHMVQYGVQDLPTGVYYYTLRYNDEVRSSKMFVNK
ncbi:MAG: T9SS type A sorting domain-containing protein [Bacteroidetes bacterium]|nr:T9SS type A sorting domain-containing protein [Bacteroidota bacterium]